VQLSYTVPKTNQQKEEYKRTGRVKVPNQFRMNNDDFVELDIDPMMIKFKHEGDDLYLVLEKNVWRRSDTDEPLVRS
jgi:hypothetical protein